MPWAFREGKCHLQSRGQDRFQKGSGMRAVSLRVDGIWTKWRRPLSNIMFHVVSYCLKCSICSFPHWVILKSTQTLKPKLIMWEHVFLSHMLKIKLDIILQFYVITVYFMCCNLFFSIWIVSRQLLPKLTLPGTD